uniref:Neural proliferation, differentiation and control, 1b n=1 Tax=Sphaeramia orbicularis TaxID=375764 RepID=A0A672YJY4_9TELE
MCLKTPESVQVFDVSVVCPSAGSHLCPRSLDCARAGRHFCQQGSSHCGPCLRPLVENSHGRCVIKRRHLSHSTQSAKGGLIRHCTGHQYVASPDPYVLRTRLSSVAIMSSASNVPRPADRPFVLTLCMYFFSVLSSVFVVGGSVALIIAGTCWSVSSADVTECKLKPLSCPLLPLTVFQPGDKKLAHSAQMYHYQHQKQQMLSLEKHREGPKVPDSGASTDEENEDGDFTVYECPGLAPVSNLFFLLFLLEIYHVNPPVSGCAF